MRNKEYTLESLRALRITKQQEVKHKGEEIAATTRKLFNPTPKKSSFSSTFSMVSNGIAVFDGFMLGMKIIKRIRKLLK